MSDLPLLWELLLFELLLEFLEGRDFLDGLEGTERLLEGRDFLEGTDRLDFLEGRDFTDLFDLESLDFLPFESIDFDFLMGFLSLELDFDLLDFLSLDFDLLGFLSLELDLLDFLPLESLDFDFLDFLSLELDFLDFLSLELDFLDFLSLELDFDFLPLSSLEGADLYDLTAPDASEQLSSPRLNLDLAPIDFK